MFVRCCRDCQEEEIEVEANHTCQTCSCHLCDYHSKIHVRKNKNHQITDHSSQAGSSSLTLKKCNQHQSEINCFCRDCEQLVCSLCAVIQHGKHNVFLIECIVQEERKIVKDQLDRHLKQRDEWMKQNSISEQVLQNELGFIENTGTDLKNKINSLFEKLKDQLYQRRDVLLKKVDSECMESTQLVRKVLNQTAERIALEKAFSDISTMHGYELLDKKVGLLKSSMKLFNEMTSQLENVDLCKVHNICLERIENDFYEDAENTIQQLGTVNKYCKPSRDSYFPQFGSSILKKNYEKDSWVLYRISFTEPPKQKNEFSYRVKIHNFQPNSNNRGISFGIVDASARTYIGETKYSYGLAFLSGRAFSRKKSHNYSSPLSIGDVVEVVLKNGNLSFKINNKDCGLAFNCNTTIDYEPAISVRGKSVHMELY